MPSRPFSKWFLTYPTYRAFRSGAFGSFSFTHSYMRRTGLVTAVTAGVCVGLFVPVLLLGVVRKSVARIASYRASAGVVFR